MVRVRVRLMISYNRSRPASGHSMLCYYQHTLERGLDYVSIIHGGGRGAPYPDVGEDPMGPSDWLCSLEMSVAWEQHIDLLLGTGDANLVVQTRAVG